MTLKCLSLAIILIQNIDAVFAISKYFGLGKSVLDDVDIQDPSHTILTTTAVSVTVCFYFCAKDSQCMSFSYNTESQICKLYDVVYGSGEKGVVSDGTRHYDVGVNGKS